MNKFQFDITDFEQKFEKEIFPLKHDLVNHPLFSLEKLIEASHRLPKDSIEFNPGDGGINKADQKHLKDHLSPEETIRNISECKTWLGLKWVNQLPEYKQVMDELLDSVKPAIDLIYPNMYSRQAFIFITSPNSTVPFHMDHEHNFLLQIQGGKKFTAFDKFDHELIPEIEVENHCSQGGRKLALKSELASRGKIHTLKPGDALHSPTFAPHYVQNDDSISISLSMTYVTPELSKRTTIYKLNHHLRKLGLKPSPYGQSPWRDNLKFNASQRLTKTKSLIRSAIK